MSKQVDISLTVNGAVVKRRVDARLNLADFLRDELQLTGTHVGCEHGVCGACSIRYNGDVIRGCLIFAIQAEGAEIETIEGLSERGVVADLQDAFQEHNALQCGFCTSGMLMTAAEYIENTPQADRTEIREFISGNYCRCTGYQSIVNAIEDVIRKRQSGGAS